MRGNPRAEDIFRHTARATRWAANEANTNQACAGGAFAVRDAVRGDRVRARVRGEQSQVRGVTRKLAPARRSSGFWMIARAWG